jgi:hypothetical protein
MKSLKYAKKINEEASAFAQLIETYCTKINKEYMKQMLQLLEEIAIGENIDLSYLKQKYIKNSKQDTDESKKQETDDNEVLLDKIIHDNKIYYIDKTNNEVYDIHSDKIGIYKNNTIQFL